MTLKRPIRLLLLDTTRWAVGGRLAARFIAAGCEVATVRLPKGYPGDEVQRIGKPYRYSGLDPKRAIRNAMLDYRPTLVIPVGDRASQHLKELHGWALAHGDQQTAEQIEVSIGAAQNYGIISSRYELLRLAAELGIRIPDMQPIHGEDDIHAFAAAHPFPWVIKADGSWGGQGVVQVRDISDALRTCRRLSQRPGVPALLSRLSTNRDWTIHYGDWRRPAPAILAQSWVEGWPANCGVVSWQGEVLAGIPVEVTATASATGPSRMVEVVDGAEMLEATRHIAARLQMSGFFGLDFMIERDTRQPYLIEMNARCTPCCALQLGKGRNLPEALVARLTGEPELDLPPRTALKKIAYFPHPEWGMSKPADAAPDWYYDLPLEAPEMMEILMHPWRERSLFGLFIDRLAAAPKQAAGKRELGSSRQSGIA